MIFFISTSRGEDISKSLLVLFNLIKSRKMPIFVLLDLNKIILYKLLQKKICKSGCQIIIHHPGIWLGVAVKLAWYSHKGCRCYTYRFCKINFNLHCICKMMFTVKTEIPAIIRTDMIQVCLKWPFNFPVSIPITLLSISQLSLQGFLSITAFLVAPLLLCIHPFHH